MSRTLSLKQMSVLFCIIAHVAASWLLGSSKSMEVKNGAEWSFLSLEVYVFSI